VAFREGGEDPEEGCPEEYKEGDDKQPDRPCRGVLRGEEVPPVAAVGRGKEVILDEDGDEEPEDDFAACHGGVEGGDLAGGLAVVVREAEVED